MPQQFGGHRRSAAAHIRVQRYPRLILIQNRYHHPGRQPQRKRSRMGILALRHAPPYRCQLGVPRPQFLANQLAPYRLVEPVDALVNLPESPAPDISGYDPVPDDFLLYRPVGLPQPVHWVVHFAPFPTDFVVVEKRTSRLGDTVNLIKHGDLVDLILGLWHGVGVRIIHHVFHQPAFMLLLLVIRRRGDAYAHQVVRPGSQSGQCVAKRKCVEAGHCANLRKWL